MSEVLDVLSPVATLVVGWLFGRKKRKADVQSRELDNVQKALKIYRDIVEDMQAKMRAMDAEMQKLRGEIAKLEQQVEEYREKYEP